MSTFTLLYQTHSPYARKALVFAHEAGLAEHIAVVHHETSPTARNAEVYAHNPLGKVPVLLRPHGPPLFDSDVICAFFNDLAGRAALIPAEGESRWRALRLQALAQCLCDTGIAYRWETVRRPENLRYPALRDGYAQKLIACYDWLEEHADFDQPLHIGHISIATALSWVEFRELPGFRTRSAGSPRGRLASWFDAFEQRPSMRATPLAGNTHD